MRLTFLSFSMLAAITASSQSNVINVDQYAGRLPAREFYASGGFPLNSAKYIKINSGSPYLSEHWLRGALATEGSSGYGNLLLKLDLLENSIAYKNDKGEEMICTTPVTVLTIRDSIKGKNYLFLLGSTIPAAEPKVWYEVLTSGKLTLYKQHHKDIYESKPYGSSVTEQTIRTSERYFIATNGTFTRVKKPNEITTYVTGKSSKELSEYINKQKLNGKKETDYIAAVEYYNSLVK